MKIAWDWLGEYLNPLPGGGGGGGAQAAAEALMNAGLPVESIVDALGVSGPTKVLDVEVTSNRTDCFCHVGLARELSAIAGGNFSLPKIVLPAAVASDVNSPATAVTIQDMAGCPYYSACVIHNVKIGPSPEWLAKRLESIGLRPVNNVVDVTNFVLMELGQPLHAFDLDRLNEKRIVVRRALKDEKMQAIDGKEYALTEEMLVIADAQNPVAIAGVMGGKATEVSEKTTTILLESAHFEQLTVRTTSRALGLRSDASFRFERGIDPAMAELASQRAAQLILQVAGGELVSGVVSAGSPGIKHAPTIKMRLERFRQIVGISISPERALSILNALGFNAWFNENSAVQGDEEVCACVPSFRLDVKREIDLIEEVARVHGYEHVPALDRVTHAVAPEPVREKAARALRSAMIEAGFSEAVTVTFVAEAEARAFLHASAGAGGNEAATLIHPQHAGWKSEVLRPSLLPSLLAVRRTNQYAGIDDARIFETAEIYWQLGDAKTAAPSQRRVLSAVSGDLASLTALLALLPDRLNPAAKMWVEPGDFPFYVRGAAGAVVLQIATSKSTIGHVGLITEELQKKYDLRHAVAGIELDWETLLGIFEPVRRAHPVPRFPAVTRDLSVVVEESVRWAQIESALRAAGLAELDSIDFVTTFRNKQVGEGKKSLTLKLEFRNAARTLTSEEVDGQVKRAVEVLAAKFAAVLRA